MEQHITSGSHRFFNILFLLTLVSLSFSLFFFSIFESLLDGTFPDEIAALNLIEADNGILKSSYMYWKGSTLNRVSANIFLFTNCWLLNILSWKTWTGWVFLRFLACLMIPISISFFLKGIIKTNSLIILSLSFIISAFGFFLLCVIKQTLVLLLLDHSIYSVFLGTFFLTIGFFIRDPNSYHKWIFYFTFLFMCNSHEVALIVGGILIFIDFAQNNPQFYSLFGEKSHGLLGLWKMVRSDKRMITLLTLWALSATVTLLAPSLQNRYKIWPVTGTVMDGLHMAFQVMSMRIHSIVVHYDIFAILLTLGGCISIFSTHKDLSSLRKNRILIVFIILSPLLIDFILGYLLGITPILLCPKKTPLPFFSTYFSHAFPSYFLGARQALFGSITLPFSIFFIGYCAGALIQSTHFFRTIHSINFVWLQRIILSLFFSLLMFLAVIHPDREIFMTFVRYLKDDTLLFLVKPQTTEEQELNRFLFKRRQVPDLFSLVLHTQYHKNLLKLKKENQPYQSVGISKLYEDIYFTRVSSDKNIWAPKIAQQYGLKIFEGGYFCERIQSLGLGSVNDHNCGPVRKIESLKKEREGVGKKIKESTIHFDQGQGLLWNKNADLSVSIRENSARAEHFLVHEIKESPGSFASFRVKLKDLNIEQGFVYIGDGTEGLYIFLIDNHWHMGETKNLDLLWKQTRYEGNDITLEFLIKKIPHKSLIVRWQNGKRFQTDYKGSKKHSVTLSDFKYAEYRKKEIK